MKNNQMNILISYKAKILNELKNGKKREFYKNCYMKDYAFDVVVDDMKFEIHPCGFGYWRGAEAVNLNENWKSIDFTDKELYKVFVQKQLNQTGKIMKKTEQEKTTNEVYEERYDNGQVWWRSRLKNDELDGPYEEYYENGQLAERSNHNHSMLDGLREMWHENGQLKSLGTFKNGAPDGLFVDWYPNGQLESRIYDKNFEKDGLWEEWYENGQLRFRKNFKNGKQEGLTEAWDETGKLVYSANYKDGIELD